MGHSLDLRNLSKRLLFFEKNSAYQYILLGIVTLIAIALRFYKLGEWSFWIEEIHTIRDALALDNLLKGLAQAHPLYYVLTRPVLLFVGVNEWNARVPSALIGSATIPVLFVVIKRILGFPVALVSIFLLAISPWHIFWSQTARFYTLLLLFINLALVAYFWGIETNRFKYIVFSVVSWGLAVLAHETGVLLVFIVTAYFFLLKILPIEKPKGLRLRNLAPFLAIPLAGYVSLELFGLFSGQQLFISRFVSAFLDWFVGRTVYGPYELLVNTVHNIGPPLVLLTFIGGFYSIKKKDRFGILMSLSVLIPLFFLLLATQFVYVNWRYMFFTLPAWAILAAVALKELLYQAMAGTKYWLLAVAFGVLYMFLKANVVKDTLIQLIKNNQTELILAMALIAIFLLIALLMQFAYPLNRLKRTPILVWTVGVVFLLLLIPLWSDLVYFEYTHGGRENWRAASTVVKDGRIKGDTVVSYLPPLPNYYLSETTAVPHRSDISHLGREASNTYKVDIEAVLQQGGRVWIFEEFGMSHETIEGIPFTEWAKKHCKLVYDDVARGWIRVHFCTATQVSETSLKN